MPIGVHGLWRPTRPLGYIDDPDALAYFAAMNVQPDSTRKMLIAAYIESLKSADLWNRFDILYRLDAHDEQAATLNLKNPALFTAAPSNSPVFVIDRGFTGDGLSARLATPWIPATHGVNYKLDDCSIWVWVASAGAEAGADLGNVSNPRCRISSRTVAGSIGGSVNDGAASTYGVVATSIGFTGLARADSAARKAWKNGVQNGLDVPTTSTSLPIQAQWICAANPTSFATKQIAMAAWGDALTGLEAALYSIELTYRQQIGAI